MNQPQVFTISKLVPRENSPTSRSARLVNAELTGAAHLFAGVFWSDPGSISGWSYGPSDPRVQGCPHFGETWRKSTSVWAAEWSSNGKGARWSAERGTSSTCRTGGQWYRTRAISDVPVEMFYVMSPPPTWLWSLGKKGDPEGGSIS